MNANSLITKDYVKNDVFAAKKTNPKQTQFSYIDAPTPIFSSKTRICPQKRKIPEKLQFPHI